MKTFELACPYCTHRYHLRGNEIDDFYDGHVANCRGSELAAVSITGTGMLAGPLHIEARSFLESIRVVGRLLVRLFDREGALKHVQLVANLVVDAGKGLIIDRLQGVGGPPAVPDFQAIGTGTTAAAAGNTALETEIGTRVQGTLSQPTALTDRLVSTFVAGNGTGAITEYGRLNASSGGVLLARTVAGVNNKAAGDSIQTTHDITIS